MILSNFPVIFFTYKYKAFFNHITNLLIVTISIAIAIAAIASIASVAEVNSSAGNPIPSGGAAGTSNVLSPPVDGTLTVCVVVRGDNTVGSPDEAWPIVSTTIATAHCQSCHTGQNEENEGDLHDCVGSGTMP